VVKLVVRKNSMRFNSPNMKDNYYEYGDEKGTIMAQIIDKFDSLNLVINQHFTILQAFDLN
jgi:hypothetical protein